MLKRNIEATIEITLIVLLILIIVLYKGISLFGIDVFTVLSGSMEPAYHTGSLIYVKDVDTNQLEIGDVITFYLTENVTATHRIVAIIPDDTNPDFIRFHTKGDANRVADTELVDEDDVVGKVIFTVPYLGFLPIYIQHPGIKYPIIILAMFLFYTVIDDIVSIGNRKPKNKRASDHGYH